MRRLRSLDDLDLVAAWLHLQYWVRRLRDVPDRLPFEVLDRINHGGPPQLQADHHLFPVVTVMATKGSGTVRPFVRISPTDLLLYQALVDALAPDIEEALGDRNKVMAFRRYAGQHDDQFHESPRWRDFMSSVRGALYANSNPLSGRPRGYALSADIASYFVYIDVDELERRLLAVTDRTVVVRDLGNLLRAWQQVGVRGLPQGVPPSSVLGNFYLYPVDRAFESWGVDFRRYMDDVWVFTRTFSHARRIQDQLERLLYEDGLGLGGEKLRIRRSDTALDDTRTAEEEIEERREAERQLILAGLDPYVEEDVELDEAEIDEAAVHGEYNDLILELGLGIPRDARSRFTAVYRELERARDPYAIEHLPEVLRRMPNLIPQAMRYLVVARAEDADDARRALLDLIGDDRFHRDQEWLHLCRAALRFRHRPSPVLAERMKEVGLTHPHPLVRARALLAWGSQSNDEDFTLADEMWQSTAAQWRTYILVSIQNKDEGERDHRYDSWSGEARFLRMLADAIRDRPFPWRVV